MVHLRHLHEAYGDRVEFLFVAIHEAPHPLSEEIARVVEGQAAPAAAKERSCQVLRAGMKHYHLSFPCLLDSAAREVEKLYTAWPLRLVLVDIDGRIMQPPGSLESWLSEQPRTE